MGKGPTIYARLEDERVAELEARTTQIGDFLVDGLKQSLRQTSLGLVLREAYRRGVVDGYAQGIAAAEASHTNEGGT